MGNKWKLLFFLQSFARTGDRKHRKKLFVSAFYATILSFWECEIVKKSSLNQPNIPCSLSPRQSIGGLYAFDLMLMTTAYLDIHACCDFGMNSSLKSLATAESVNAFFFIRICPLTFYQTPHFHLQSSCLFMIW